MNKDVCYLINYLKMYLLCKNKNKMYKTGAGSLSSLFGETMHALCHILSIILRHNNTFIIITFTYFHIIFINFIVIKIHSNVLFTGKFLF